MLSARTRRAVLIVADPCPIEGRCADERPHSFGARPWCDVPAAALKQRRVSCDAGVTTFREATHASSVSSIPRCADQVTQYHLKARRTGVKPPFHGATGDVGGGGGVLRLCGAEWAQVS